MMDTDLPPEAPARGSFLGNVNVVVLTYIADGVLAFATGIIIARALGPEGRGAYGLFVLTTAFAQIVLGLGLGNAVIYYLNKREISMRDAVTTAHTVTLAAGGLTALVLAVAVPLLPGGWLGDGVTPWLFAAAVPALLYWNLMRFLLQAESRFIDLGVTTLAQQVLLLGAIALVAVAGDPTPGQAAACFAAATAAAGAVGFARVGPRHLDAGVVLRPRLAVLRRLAGFGVQGESGNMLQLLNYRMDQYIVRYFVGLAGVGIYAVSASLTEAMFVVANAVALVLLPRMTANEDEAGWMAPLATRNTVIVAAGGALVLAAAAPVLVPLAFGDAYRDSIEPLWILLPGTVALAGSKVLTSYIFSQGRPLVNTAITAASLVVTLGTNLLFVPLFDVKGAALASSLAYAAHFAFALIAFGRISGQSPVAALIPGREDLRLYGDARRSLLARLGRQAPAGAGGPPA